MPQAHKKDADLADVVRAHRGKRTGWSLSDVRLFPKLNLDDASDAVSQRALAALLKKSDAEVSRFEQAKSGKKGVPRKDRRIGTLRQYLKALGLELRLVAYRADEDRAVLLDL